MVELFCLLNLPDVLLFGCHGNVDDGAPEGRTTDEDCGFLKRMENSCGGAWFAIASLGKGEVDTVILGC